MIAPRLTAPKSIASFSKRGGPIACGKLEKLRGIFGAAIRGQKNQRVKTYRSSYQYSRVYFSTRDLSINIQNATFGIAVR